MIDFLPAVIAELLSKLIKALKLPLKKGPPVDRL